MENEGFNGYANYETWNVSLWYCNDEGLYELAKEAGDYSSFVERCRELGIVETPDQVALNDSSIDTSELDQEIAELE